MFRLDNKGGLTVNSNSYTWVTFLFFFFFFLTGRGRLACQMRAPTAPDATSSGCMNNAVPPNSCIVRHMLTGGHFPRKIMSPPSNRLAKHTLDIIAFKWCSTAGLSVEWRMSNALSAGEGRTVIIFFEKNLYFPACTGYIIERPK